MSSPDNLINQKFGNLIVIKKLNQKNNCNIYYWECLCLCGRIDIVRGDVLKTRLNNKCKFCRKNRHIGDKINRLTIIKILNKRIHNQIETFYICQCDCGEKRKIKSSNLKTTKECLKCYIKRKQNRSMSKSKNYESIRGVYWDSLIYGAKSRNLEFNITQEYVWQIWINQNNKCALSGIYIHFPKDLSKKLMRTGTVSLDRIDSNKGYIEGNVQWIHKKFQKMKMNLEEKDFIQNCIEITNYQNLKQTGKTTCNG